MNQREVIELIQKELQHLYYYHEIEADISRIVGLVQANQSFFGDPPAGQSCIKVAADKLEELVMKSRGPGFKPTYRTPWTE